MKKPTLIQAFSIGFVCICLAAFTFQNNPWNASQVIQPEELAELLDGPASKQPVILNMGTMPPIKNAKMIGIGNSTHGMNKLKEYSSKIDKSKTVVVYCGCCTMDNCPNIRQPMEYLISQGFINAKVLNIKTDLSTDWTNKGYPMN
ncbi:MAG: hypothetical protein ACK4ND_00975 [Cytophagaceae bacterium]